MNKFLINFAGAQIIAAVAYGVIWYFIWFVTYEVPRFWPDTANAEDGFARILMLFVYIIILCISFTDPDEMKVSPDHPDLLNPRIPPRLITIDQIVEYYKDCGIPASSVAYILKHNDMDVTEARVQQMWDAMDSPNKKATKL
jgi:hypothetical protein